MLGQVRLPQFRAGSNRSARQIRLRAVSDDAHYPPVLKIDESIRPHVETLRVEYSQDDQVWNLTHGEGWTNSCFISCNYLHSIPSLLVLHISNCLCALRR
jgi:hypothetical protein